MTTPTPALEVHSFWFKTLGAKDWFKKNPKLDRRITASFGPLVIAAPTGALEYWRITPTGRLAEILVLDQFSRNIYRDRPEAFAGDTLALGLAKDAIDAGAAKRLSDDERAFLYMPFMHSESLAEHQRALELFAESGLERQLKHEKQHLAILKRFGRYPQRNTALGRQSTPEEVAFLQKPGSQF